VLVYFATAYLQSEVRTIYKILARVLPSLVFTDCHLNIVNYLFILSPASSHHDLINSSMKSVALSGTQDKVDHFWSFKTGNAHC